MESEGHAMPVPWCESTPMLRVEACVSLALGAAAIGGPGRGVAVGFETAADLMFGEPGGLEAM